MRKIDLIIIHRSATREGRCSTECGLGICHRRRGSNGPDYHFYIRRDGRIVSTRPIEHVRAHAYGFNVRSVGICYEGGLNREGHPKGVRTPEQKRSMRMLVRTLLTDYPGCGMCGHRDLSTDLNGNEEIEPGEWVKVRLCFETSLREVFG